MNCGFGRDLSCDDNLILLLLVCGSASRHVCLHTSTLHIDEQEFNNVIIYYIFFVLIDLLFTYSSTLFSLLFLISNAFIMF